jgi:hypothetical protein
MAEWIPIGGDFIAADVIRWKEGVFKNRRNKKAKPIRTGERLVTAEVLRDEAGWVYLLVRACEVTSAAFGWDIRDVRSLSKNTEIKRKRVTIARGKAERLLWSDESARVVVVGQLQDERGAFPSPEGLSGKKP